MDHDEELWSRRSCNRKFMAVDIYGENFDSTLFEGVHSKVGIEHLTHVPCPYGSRCPKCGSMSRHFGAIVVAIDGACRGFGTADAKGAIGVYFGEASPSNLSIPIIVDHPTNHKMKLYACIRALKEVYMIDDERFGRNEKSGRPGRVVIKTDSEYVVKAMTEWIFKWRLGDWTTATGSPVANVDLLYELETSIQELKGKKFEVLFWHVPKAMNKEANQLANKGLD